MKYEQLSDEAKAAARQWFKKTESETWGSDRAPDYYEDMATCLKFLGITVSESASAWQGADGKIRHGPMRPDFRWSGFWSQGDGLVFEGSWDAKDVDMAGLQAYAPEDATLHRIATQMVAIMLACPTSHADITTVSYGPGLPGMHVDCAYVDSEDEIPMPAEHEELLKEQMIAAAHWCYKQLETNYEYDTSDEAAEEGIVANAYEFDEGGDVSLRGCSMEVAA